MEPDYAHATIHRRGSSGGFFIEEYSGLEALIPLPEVEIELSLADVYLGLGA